MSRNAEIVRKGYEAWKQDDPEAWLQTLHPDIEFSTSGVWPAFDPVYCGGARSHAENVVSAQ
jgi:ketosteroid isomerase-like protein